MRFEKRLAGYLLSSLAFVSGGRTWTGESIDEASDWCAARLDGLIFRPCRGRPGMAFGEMLRVADSLDSRERESFLNSCAENAASDIVENGFGGFAVGNLDGVLTFSAGSPSPAP